MSNNPSRDFRVDLAAINAQREHIKATYLREASRPAGLVGPRPAPLRAGQLRRRAHRALLPGAARVPADRDLREPRLRRLATTSSSTSATATCWPSSTSPASTSAPTPRCSAACTTSRSRSTPDRWEHLRAKLDDAGVEYLLESEVSIYFRDPDGARLELLADPLGEMYGSKVL